MQGRSIRRSGQPTCASASRMRAFDRDLIRGRHYGQRSCEPHKQAEHMAAPTNLQREEKPCQLGAVHTWHNDLVCLPGANGATCAQRPKEKAPLSAGLEFWDLRPIRTVAGCQLGAAVL
jgi:hypothetical protein